MFWVDLHTHTTASDGLDSPAELVRRASAQGISLLAVTDHDTTSGVTEALETAAQQRIQLISGVEFSIRSARGQTHILGYGIDTNHRALQTELDSLRHGRAERGRQILLRLSDLGIELPLEDAALRDPQQSPGRPHIARSLVEIGAADSVADAFDRYLSVGRPAFVSRRTLSAERAIELILESGGVAVLAHPLSVYQLEAQLDRFIEQGLTGLEAYYGEYSECQRQELAGLAHSMGLLATGGSDYHGDPDSVGRALGAVEWPAEDVEALLERLG